MEHHCLGFVVMKLTQCECDLHHGVKAPSQEDKAVPDVCVYISSASKCVNKTRQK